MDDLTRILVVDDDPIDVNFLKKTFANAPQACELFHVESSDGVVEAAVSHGCNFIFVDLNLKGESGLAAVEKLKTNDATAAIPIIILSSSAHKADIERCYRAGASAYVEKPLSLDQYRQFVKSFCEFWIEIALIARGASE